MENFKPKNQDYYEQMHKKDMFSRRTSLSERDCYIIKGLIAGTGSKTILDFGSGKGDQYEKFKRHRIFSVKRENITCYDPGVPEFREIPTESFHGVISTDVLEHIPEEEIAGALKLIFEKAERFVYLAIHCGLAFKKLPNGENAHCTIKHPRAWDTILDSYNTKNVPLIVSYRIPTDPKHDILGISKK